MSQALAPTINLPLLGASRSLEAYIQAVRSLPMLAAEEERELARRLQGDGDLEAARRLVLSHLRLVVKVARGYDGYGLPQADLIQEGNIGLMKAVRRFDPEVGVRLVSFALHWIKAEIHEFILRNWRIVKVATTKAQRKLFFRLRSTRARLGWMRDGERREVARLLDVSEAEVGEMEGRMSALDASIEQMSNPDEGPARLIADTRLDPARLVEDADSAGADAQGLARALGTLDGRSRAIVEARFLAEEKSTLAELAGRFGVSAERIRQLEAAALGRLRQALGAATA